MFARLVKLDCLFSFPLSRKTLCGLLKGQRVWVRHKLRDTTRYLFTHTAQPNLVHPQNFEKEKGLNGGLKESLLAGGVL